MPKKPLFKLLGLLVLFTFALSACGGKKEKTTKTIPPAKTSDKKTEDKTKPKPDNSKKDTKSKDSKTPNSGDSKKTGKDTKEDKKDKKDKEDEKDKPKGDLAKNPLLLPSKLSYEAVPWDKIKPEHFVPAAEFALKKALDNFNKIINNPEKPTFENTIEALESYAADLEKVLSTFYTVYAPMQNVYTDVSPKIQDIYTQFQKATSHNKKLFKRVDTLVKQKITLKGLSPEQLRLLDITHQGFLQSGIDKSEEVLKQLKDLNAQISKLTENFGKTSTASGDVFVLHVKDKKELKGLSKATIEAAAKRAEGMKMKGYVLANNNGATWGEARQFAENRELRKKLWLMRHHIAYNQKENDNRATAVEISKLRLQKAKLLGLKSFSTFQLQDKMAANPDNVMKFMDDLLAPIKAKAQKEIDELIAFKKSKGKDETLNPWDQYYWQNLYKKEKLSADYKKVKEYLLLDNVLTHGVLGLGESYWGLKFKKRTDLPTHHKDVIVYEVLDEKSEPRALVYLDLFARKGKRAGAWMSNYRSRFLNNSDSSPNNKVALINVVANFAPPEKGKPITLSVDDANTLFHEFGHAYHALLSDTQYASLSGSNVAQDFVEVPSQVPESFLYESEVLKKVAINSKGEALPKELLDGIVKAKQYGQGLFELRQMWLAYTDMAWHTISDESQLPTKDTIGQFDRKIWDKVRAYKLDSDLDFSVSTSFGHIFAGGYASGYYGYQWARVIGADLYAAFTENGGFSLEKAKPVAQKLRKEILSKGNSAHPAELYKKFRGREYDSSVFLKNLGISK